MPTAAFQTPLVEQSIKARYKIQDGDVALKWCGINSLLCTVFSLRLGGALLSALLSLSPEHSLYATYIEVSLAVVCGIAALCDIITYATSRRFKSQLDVLSPAQSLLLNIKARPLVSLSPPSCETTLGRSPSPFETTPTKDLPVGPSPHHTPTPTIRGDLFTPPLSTSLTSGNNMTLNSSFNASFHSLNSTSNVSFATPLRDGDSSFKLAASPKIRKTVSDINDLSNYLKEYEEKDKWLSRGGSDRSLSSGWAPRASETLPPRAYFLASQNTSVSVAGDTSFYNQQAADALLDRLGVAPHFLDSWTQNIRMWLSQTIFQHLQREIQMINKTLEQIGSAECKIGTVSTAVLSKISTNKHEHMANIALVLPYLEVSVNQEYLVHRIGELAAGSCLGCFRWESGGQYKNAPWNKELPTDSQIVAHCVNTYLDSHLPRNPMYPEGRTFTTQYFVQTPSKADNKKRDYALFQSSIHPPHFKVLVGEEVWEVSKGRNNLFHSLLLLLFHLRAEEHGMLGPVNLGPTGLNMLWIIEQ